MIGIVIVIGVIEIFDSLINNVLVKRVLMNKVKLMVYRNLVEMVVGIRIIFIMMVENMMLISDFVIVKVDVFICGVKIINIEDNGDLILVMFVFDINIGFV